MGTQFDFQFPGGLSGEHQPTGPFLECISEEAEVRSNLQQVKAALMSVLLTGEVRVTPDEEAA